MISERNRDNLININMGFDQQYAHVIDEDGYRDVSLHWLTITQIIKDEITNEIWMKVQSWGRVFFINFKEWLSAQSGTYWDSILFIQ